MGNKKEKIKSASGAFHSGKNTSKKRNYDEESSINANNIAKSIYTYLIKAGLLNVILTPGIDDLELLLIYIDEAEKKGVYLGYTSSFNSGRANVIRNGISYSCNVGNNNKKDIKKTLQTYSLVIFSENGISNTGNNKGSVIYTLNSMESKFLLDGGVVKMTKEKTSNEDEVVDAEDTFEFTDSVDIENI